MSQTECPKARKAKVAGREGSFENAHSGCFVENRLGRAREDLGGPVRGCGSPQS